MFAAILDQPGRYLLEEVEPLAPESGEVVVEVSVGLACVTDVIQRQDGGGLADAHIRGHAGVGTVVEIGTGVTRVSVGQRVLMPTRPKCEKCLWCRTGQPEQCEAATAPGPYTARRADGTLLRGSARVGSFAERTRIREIQVVPVESDISDEELALLGCGGGGGLGAILNTANVDGDSTVAIIGAGVFGLSAVQAARIAGAERIVVVEPIATRRALARALGATDVIDPTATDPVVAVQGLCDGVGASTVLEGVCGGPFHRQAFDMARRGGEIVLGGFGRKSDISEFPSNDLGMRGKRLLSCQFGSVDILRDIPRFVGFIEKGDYDAASLTGKRFPLAQVNEALDMQERNEILGACIGG